MHVVCVSLFPLINQRIVGTPQQTTTMNGTTSSSSGSTAGLLGGLCGDILRQIVNLLNTDEVKKQLIDPLVDYYKNRLFVFYGIITLLLLIVILSNFYIIYRLCNN